ncbi:biliverdin-producing heme oxygenase [Deinococcus sp. YIM 77859]|uniref:biliverdin-producing heme oxygenase n=1 Tax=Deinococcus sp. YIM 77859 TaxID=1540221 RepID=UPI00054F7DE4|nr:biliverdin-producing heme oxygenase [Deinococcus sp. YIM 77859]
MTSDEQTLNPEIMVRLKEMTREQHDAVERLFPVFEPTFDRRRYAALLGQLAQVVFPLEAHLLSLPLPAAFQLPKRLKSAALLEDLRVLGVEPASAPPAYLRLPPDVPTALGALYVLEGSTLGGQVLSRQLQARLALTPKRGLRYFSGYGPQTGAMWLAFGRALRQHVRPGEDLRVIEGAQQTFAAFECALTGVSA